MTVQTLTKCPACGGRDLRDLPRWHGTRLRQCRSCRVVCAPEYEDPDTIYTDGYFSDEKTDFGIDLRHPNWRRFGAFAASRRLRFLEGFVPRGRLLDVGCGIGDFVHGAAENGWDAVGAEPIAETAEAARERGLDVRTGRVEEVGFDRRSFDVVSALHVLEHMDDAIAFVRLIADWARPGGLVFIEVPNWNSSNRRGFGAEWPQLRPLEHLAHYTPATLKRTLERAGLQNVRSTSLGMAWTETKALQQVETLLGPRPKLVTSAIERLVTSSEVPEGSRGPRRTITRRGRRMLREAERAIERSGRGFAAVAVATVP